MTSSEIIKSMIASIESINNMEIESDDDREERDMHQDQIENEFESLIYEDSIDYNELKNLYDVAKENGFYTKYLEFILARMQRDAQS